MANPMTHLEAFNGSLGGFTGSGPEEYDGGLLLQEATTNAVGNPSFETNTDGWTAVPGSGTAPLSRITTDHFVGSACAESVLSGGGTQGLLTLVSGAAQSDVWTGKLAVKGPPGTPVQLWIRETVSGTPNSNISETNAVLDGETNGWDLVEVTRTISGATTNGFHLRLHCANQAVTLQTDRVQAEKKAYATGYTDSTRAASSASLSPSGILSPASGGIAMRITPTIETGVEEIWGEVGAKGSGTDHVRWGRDASKHPFVEWSANNASYQRLTGSETLNALTAYDLYLGHSATTISLAVDAGTLQTGTRDAVSSSWGAGNIKLQATAGGVVYRNFATFDRVLTANEIATLNNVETWNQDTIGGTNAAILRRAR